MSPTSSSRLPRYTVSTRPEPQRYDGPLRYWVWSRTRPGVKYLVELDSYRYNGECQCEAFKFGMEPLLRRGFTPAQAVREKLVRLKENQRPQDALRCPHIIDGWMQWGLDAARIVHDHESNQRPKGFHEA